MSTRAPVDVVPSGPLILDTMLKQRWGVLAWAVGGGIAMMFTGLTLIDEMDSFPGGAAMLERAVLPSAEAFRFMRWPAEHLDTLGGYLTYHNITFFAFFLAIYGVIQGARVMRAGEEQGGVELVLATGWRRWAVVRDRSLGFSIGLVFITAGLAAGTAVVLAMGDASNISGALTTMTATGLCGLVGFALGVLLAQLVPTSRLAAGIGSIVLAVLYVLTNVQDEVGAFGALAYASPFTYSNMSRALVPGYGFDVGGMLVLLGMALTLLAAGAWAFTVRDYGSPLWHLPVRTNHRRTKAIQRTSRYVWSYLFWRGRIGLIAWTLTAAAFAWFYMSLAPSFMEAWGSFSFVTDITGGSSDAAPLLLYNTFATELAAPVIAAYVITQAANWAADLEQGRVEMLVATKVSAAGLVIERLIALTLSMIVMITILFSAIAVSGYLSDNTVDTTSLLRTAICTLLFGLSLAGIAALLVAIIRSGTAVIVLAVYVGAAYLLTLLVPILDWPEWLQYFSIFWAFGHPFLDWPETGGLILMGGMVVVGVAAGAWFSERLPKVT